ncbi:DNA topoisomerase IB [Nakamurella leprariae]|uniref:DNA topoisomerase n=1 Tax=Nakamurella leprariae TaxID=2803911 RepID=A0A939C3C8_9ACTN|nr:DNA topoisomerase IB [Nakamurella leprariae]MBM9469284.1 DNA topoisomerase IB [Nakamurella leprariae]
MPARLRRSHPDRPGLTRRRRGRGWQYLDTDGAVITDPEIRRRIDDLVIPPAWKQVWISPFPNGHIQAIGTDAAGRRQYLYHPEWALRRHQRKFERVLQFGAALPPGRRQVSEHLALPGMGQERAMATAFRLLDRGHFRIGGEVYTETNGSYGLSTLLRSHVRRERGVLIFDYIAKSGMHRVEKIEDPELLDSIETMRRRRGGDDRLLAYRVGRDWRHLGSTDINLYLKEVLRGDISAKDFRTWHGTVLAAVALAQLSAAHPASKRWSATARKRAVSQAVKAVASRLGNTPAVCRGSYIDPRVVEAFESERTINTAVERAARDLAGVLPDPVDDESAEQVLSLIAATPTVERAVLKLLRS